MIWLDDARRRRELGQLDEPLPDPLLVGMFAGDTALQLFVGDDPLLACVHEEHAAGLESALGHDLVRGDVEDPGLRGHDYPTVGGDPVPGRPKTVAVERGADSDAVGKGDRGRAVPRFHQAGMELVKGPLLRRHRLVMLPGLRHHHHQGVGNRPPR